MVISSPAISRSSFASTAPLRLDYPDPFSRARSLEVTVYGKARGECRPSIVGTPRLHEGNARSGGGARRSPIPSWHDKMGSRRSRDGELNGLADPCVRKSPGWRPRQWSPGHPRAPSAVARRLPARTDGPGATRREGLDSMHIQTLPDARTGHRKWGVAPSHVQGARIGIGAPLVVAQPKGHQRLAASVACPIRGRSPCPIDLIVKYTSFVRHRGSRIPHRNTVRRLTPSARPTSSGAWPSSRTRRTNRARPVGVSFAS